MQKKIETILEGYLNDSSFNSVRAPKRIQTRTMEAMGIGNDVPEEHITRSFGPGASIQYRVYLRGGMTTDPDHYMSKREHIVRKLKSADIHNRKQLQSIFGSDNTLEKLVPDYDTCCMFEGLNIATGWGVSSLDRVLNEAKSFSPAFINERLREYEAELANPEYANVEKPFDEFGIRATFFLYGWVMQGVRNTVSHALQSQVGVINNIMKLDPREIDLLCYHITDSVLNPQKRDKPSFAAVYGYMNHITMDKLFNPEKYTGQKSSYQTPVAIDRAVGSPQPI